MAEATSGHRTISLGRGLRVPYPEASSPAASAVGRGNRRTDTKPEVAIRSALHRSGLRFRKDLPVRVDEGRPIRVDIAFTAVRLAIFVDGCFWHVCPEHHATPRSNDAYWRPKLARNIARDAESTHRLERASWKVLRIWEHVPVDEATQMVIAQLKAMRQR